MDHLEREAYAIQTVTAKNCTIVTGLPLSKAQFDDSREHSSDSYGHGFRSGWQQYRFQWLTPFYHFLNECGELGVTYQETGSLQEISTCFDRPDMKVLLLVSHWHEEHVEWGGRFEPVGSLVECVRENFDGVLDLCICHPRTLREQLDVHRPQCLIRYSTREVNHIFWWPYFKGLFHLLNTGKYSYIAAHEELNKAIATKSRGGNEK